MPRAIRFVQTGADIPTHPISKPFTKKRPSVSTEGLILNKTHCNNDMRSTRYP